MGKGDIRKQRMYMGLIMQKADHPYIKQGSRLFMIPVDAEPKERDEIMEEQVYKWLRQLSGIYNNVQQAINEIQAWLKNFTIAHPERKPWVEASANKAGKRFFDLMNPGQKRHIYIDLAGLFRQIGG